MLKLELKRIFSKKINVFAIGLALILAVIFSGFAVTSNRYVDENGNASTGIMATRKLTNKPNYDCQNNRIRFYIHNHSIPRTIRFVFYW